MNYKNTSGHISVYYGIASLTVSATVSKDGAAASAIAGTITDRGNGIYDIALTAADRNADDITVVVNAVGMQSQVFTYHLEADYTSTIANRIDAAISSRSSHSAADVKTAIEATGSSIANILAHLVGIKGAGWASESLVSIKSFIDSIYSKVTNLPADPASNTQVNTRLAAASYTAPDNDSIAAILEDTGTTIPAALSGISVDVDSAEIAGAVAAALGGQTITVTSPLLSSGEISIVPGDTYNPDKTNRLIRFKNTGTWSNLTGATVTIEWTGTGSATCEIAASGDITTEQIIDVPLSAANTSAMEPGPFKIYATWTSPADIETLVVGEIVIDGDVL